MKKKAPGAGLLLRVIEALLLAAVLGVLLVSLRNAGKESTAEGKAQLEKAVQRAVTACYATEGVYPPSLAYLKEHYGLSIHENRYEVKYMIFAGNIVPDITVLEKAE